MTRLCARRDLISPLLQAAVSSHGTRVVYRNSAEREIDGAPSVTSDQPAVTVVEISDPTAAGAGIELIDQDAVQLQSMPLRARRVIVRLEAAAVVFHSTNRRVRTRTSVRKGLLAYVTFGPQASGTVNGLPVRPGLMLAAEPEAEAMFVADAGYESITFLLPPQDIRAHLTARQRESEFRLPHGVETLQVERGEGSAALRLGQATGGYRRTPARPVQRAEDGADRRPRRVARDSPGDPWRGQRFRARPAATGRGRRRVSS